MAERYDAVGVVEESALDMVDGIVVEHPDDPDRWIVAKPRDE